MNMLSRKRRGGLAVAMITVGLAIVAVMSSCSDDSGSSSPPEPSGAHSLGEVQANVYVGGIVSTVSEEKLVLLDFVGRQPVEIRLTEANGPGQQFFRQETNPNAALTLDQANPQLGEDICVLARLLPDGELVSWLVFLESKCQHQP